MYLRCCQSGGPARGIRDGLVPPAAHGRRLCAFACPGAGHAVRSCRHEPRCVAAEAPGPGIRACVAGRLGPGLRAGRAADAGASASGRKPVASRALASPARSPPRPPAGRSPAATRADSPAALRRTPGSRSTPGPRTACRSPARGPAASRPCPGMVTACSRPQPPARGEGPGVPGPHSTRRQQAHTAPARPWPCNTTGLPSTRDPRAPHRTIPICQIDPYERRKPSSSGKPSSSERTNAHRSAVIGREPSSRVNHVMWQERDPVPATVGRPAEAGSQAAERGPASTSSQSPVAGPVRLSPCLGHHGPRRPVGLGNTIRGNLRAVRLRCGTRGQACRGPAYGGSGGRRG